ncbi:pallilysin-related adhesin [Treponema sp.]|uniref:pallilysin-related adhesin n=1 Tax=Treponema sp. TaxID=166 RepID=UPI003FD72F1C
MQKKIIIGLLVCAVAALSVAFIVKKYFYSSDNQKVSASIVVPRVESEKEKSVENSSAVDEENTITSLVPLHSDETLISIVSMDFDGDSFDDQINAVKTSSSPYLSLVVGLYNPSISEYERMSVIPTEISQVRTFTYTGMDLTGDHRVSLVYQGFAENGDSILKAFFVGRKNGRFSLQVIADFRGDGTIFIQQVDRYDEYERSRAKGMSFPIWVYSSDVSKENTTDQLQTRYDWNEESGKYEQTRQIRVAGSRLAAKELARIQDGTVATFAGFLNGLWVKSGAREGEMSSLFFDYNLKEIIFFRDDVEEVYNWAHSTIRRNGIYLTAINQEIQNLQRRVDVSLRSVDSIHIRIQDDVRMPIIESNVWDGDYKKLTNASLSSQYTDFGKSSSKKILSLLESKKSWTTSDGTEIKFAGGRYVSAGEGEKTSGIYTDVNLGNSSFVQFRSEAGNILDGFFLATEAEDSANIILSPYRVQPDSVYPEEKRPVVLTPGADKESVN